MNTDKSGKYGGEAEGGKVNVKKSEEPS